MHKAIELTERALRMLPEGNHYLDLKSNLAYYLAESPAPSQEKWLSNKKKAETLVSEVIAWKGYREKPHLVDTVGFVKVAFGVTEEAIRSGLDECKSAIALANSQYKREIARRFYELHERHAWRRLLDLQFARVDGGHKF